MGEQGPKPGAQTRERGSDAPDPTHSQARPRQPDEKSTGARADADTKVERRASVRPSAFGAPRKSDAPRAPEADAASEVAAARSPHERVLEAARLLDALSRSHAEAHASTSRAHPQPGASTEPPARDPGADGDAPIQRLPHEPTRGADESVAGGAAPGSAEAASTRLARKPWLSLLLFAGMVALSVVHLLRNAVSDEESAPPTSATAPLRRTSPAAAATNARLEQVRSTHPEQVGLSAVGVDRERAIASALGEGSQAFEAGDVGAAERMFGRALELAEDNHRAAYGLSRIRLKQNNLSGAEGWIQLALRKRPRRAAYHALYAEVLTRMGRVGEARQELALAQANDDARAAGSERSSDPGANANSDER